MGIHQRWERFMDWLAECLAGPEWAKRRRDAATERWLVGIFGPREK